MVIHICQDSIMERILVVDISFAKGKIMDVLILLLTMDRLTATSDDGSSFT